MANSIEKLRIYKTSRQLEDQIYELVKSFSDSSSYAIGNNLRRSSAAVSHYIMESHRLFSFRLKLESLSDARREAELTQFYLESLHDPKAHSQLVDDYTSVIKQSWGLTRWLKNQLVEHQNKIEVAAKDDMARTA